MPCLPARPWAHTSMTVAAFFFFLPCLFYSLSLVCWPDLTVFHRLAQNSQFPCHSLPKCWDPGCTATPGCDISSQWQHHLAGCSVPGGNSTNLSRPPCTPPTDDHYRRSRDDVHRVPRPLRPQVSGVAWDETAVSAGLIQQFLMQLIHLGRFPPWNPLSQSLEGEHTVEERKEQI